MSVSRTIFEQLGAGRFAVMTGAKNFVSLSGDGETGPGLSFSFPGTGTKNKANHCTITLDPGLDLYSVKFAYIRGGKVHPREETCGVYWDQLQSLFTDQTGLYTRLR